MRLLAVVRKLSWFYLHLNGFRQILILLRFLALVKSWLSKLLYHVQASFCHLSFRNGCICTFFIRKYLNFLSLHALGGWAIITAFALNVSCRMGRAAIVQGLGLVCNTRHPPGTTESGIIRHIFRTQFHHARLVSIFVVVAISKRQSCWTSLDLVTFFHMMN